MNTGYPYRERRVQKRRQEVAAATARKRQRRQYQHHVRVKPDETMEMQQQVGLDVKEVSLRYSPASVADLPEALLREAQVSKVAERGTTERDQELKKARLRVAVEREARAAARRRNPLPTLEELKVSARQRQVGNDTTWEAISADERERREGLERLSKKGWWSKCVLAACFAKEASDVFTELERSELEGTKTAALELVGEHLVKLVARAKDDGHGGGGEDWLAKSWWDRMEVFMKPGRSTVLAEQRRKAKEKSAALKRAFECCGTECSQRKRFKVIFED